MATIDTRTPRLNLPVPVVTNALKDDCPRLVEAFTTLDGAVAGNIDNLREQWRRQLAEVGLTLVDGSFEEGATVSAATDAVWHIAGGQCYTWGGTLPKTVPAGSTPETAGGVGVAIGAWVSVGDASFRSVLSKNDGYSYIGELQSVVEFFGLIKRDGARVKLRSWYSGWSATSYGKPSGGGEFIYMSGVSKTKHDGCIYFSPTVPYSATLSDYVTGVGESDPTGSGVWVRDISGSTDIHSDWAGIQDGSTANSVAAHATALQSVFNAASSLLKNVKLGRGHIHVDHQVFLNPFHNDNRVLPMVYG